MLSNYYKKIGLFFYYIKIFIINFQVLKSLSEALNTTKHSLLLSDVRVALNSPKYIKFKQLWKVCRLLIGLVCVLVFEAFQVAEIRSNAKPIMKVYDTNKKFFVNMIFLEHLILQKQFQISFLGFQKLELNQALFINFLLLKSKKTV